MFILPVVFPLVMVAGGVLGIAGVPLPGVEIGIAVSAAILGMMVALAARPPLWVAAILVGAFAIFHGHAHGAELPPGADAVAFSAGFVVATGLLHLAGIVLGLLARWPWGRIVVRAAGGGDRRRRADVSRAASVTALLLPLHVMAVLSLGLLIGQQGWSRAVPAAYAAAVLVGLGAIALAAAPDFAEESLLVATALAGLLLALARSWPAGVGMALGVVVGLLLALELAAPGACAP